MPKHKPEDKHESISKKSKREETPFNASGRPRLSKRELNDLKLDAKLEQEMIENDEMDAEKLALVNTRRTRAITEARKSPNFLFYKNAVPCRPDGVMIDELHKSWYGAYGILEGSHGFIQWLFPVFESQGLNDKSKALSKAEAKLIREDITCAIRVIRSYKLMLNFYGMRLTNELTGDVERDPKIYRDRYQNMNKNTHNHLRISRIITSLGEMGFAAYKSKLVKFLSDEIAHGELAKAKRSCEKFWIPLTHETTAAYIKKTLESAEDRTPSVFFGRKDWQKLLDLDLKKYEIEQAQKEELEREKDKDEEEGMEIITNTNNNNNNANSNDNNDKDEEPEPMEISTTTTTSKTSTSTKKTKKSTKNEEKDENGKEEEN